MSEATLGKKRSGFSRLTAIFHFLLFFKESKKKKELVFAYIHIIIIIIINNNNNNNKDQNFLTCDLLSSEFQLRLTIVLVYLDRTRTY